MRSLSYSKECVWNLGTQSIHSFIYLFIREMSAGWHYRNWNNNSNNNDNNDNNNDTTTTTTTTTNNNNNNKNIKVD